MTPLSSTQGASDPDSVVLLRRLNTLSEVASTETAVFHQLAAQSLGVGLSDMKALSILLREGDKNPGELMKRLRITTGAVTSLIDRLAKKNVVVRRNDPSDRRKVIVSANQSALESGYQVYESMGKAFAALLAQYTPEELRFLERHLEGIIRITQAQIASLP